MSEKSPHLYQSGERIPITGRYIMVMVRSEPTIADQYKFAHDLEAGQYFPHHDGWPVCWFLACANQDKERPSPVFRSPAGDAGLPFC